MSFILKTWPGSERFPLQYKHVEERSVAFRKILILHQAFFYSFKGKISFLLDPLWFDSSVH